MDQYKSVKIGNLKVGASHPIVACNVSRLDCAKKAKEEDVPLLEIRCDLIEPAEISAIEERVKEIRNYLGESYPLLATVRRSDDVGGWYRFKRSESDRFEVFKRVIPYVNAVDIEYNTKITEDVLNFAHEKNVNTILSYHNFAHIPEDIEKIVEEMDNKNSDILKIACMSCSDDDFSIMLNVLQKHIKTRAKPIAIIPMGDIGTPGRYMFPWFGSCITYGCVKKKKAPGQPYVRDLMKSVSLAMDNSDSLPMLINEKKTSESLIKLENKVKEFEFVS